MYLELLNKILTYDTFKLFTFTNKNSKLFQIYENIKNYEYEELKNELFNYFFSEAICSEEFRSTEALHMCDVVIKIMNNENNKNTILKNEYAKVMRSYLDFLEMKK